MLWIILGVIVLSVVLATIIYKVKNRSRHRNSAASGSFAAGVADIAGDVFDSAGDLINFAD